MPSILKAFDDKALHYQLLEYIVDSYVPAQFDSDNPFLSPLFAPACLLARFPPTLAICGDDDPLYDHSLAFAERLDRLGVVLEGQGEDGLTQLLLPRVCACQCTFRATEERNLAGD